MEVPDRNPVKWNGTLLATSNRCCHFSCQPTPSKLTTMNCGGFSPGLSLVGTNPSGCATGSWPAADVAVATLLDAAAEPPAAGDWDGFVDAADAELGAEVGGPAVTKLVTVSPAACTPLPQAASASNERPTSPRTAFRPRPTCIRYPPNGEPDKPAATLP